jgi:predicted phage tail protein
MPGKRLPSYFQVMRRDHFKGDFRVIPAIRFLSARNDSLFILVRDTALIEHQAYEYFLTSFNRAGNPGPNSDTATLASYSFNEVYLPNQIKTRTERGMHGLLIRWRMERPELCRGLRLYRSLDHDKNFEPIADVLPTDTLYIDQNVIPMTRYYYHFRVLGVLDESSATSATVFGIYQDMQAPMPPIYPEATSDSAGVRLTWTPGDSEIKGYYVYRSTGTNPLEIITPLVTDTTYVDKSPTLSGKIVYSYALKAENTSHQISTFSDTVQARPGLKVYTPAPRALEGRVVNGRVYLSWLEMREYHDIISAYEVERADGGQSFRTVGAALDENSMIDSAVTSGNQYVYRVRAINVYGERSDWGMEAFVGIPVPSTELFPPPGLHAFRSEGVVTLRWGGIAQDGISGYNIYKRSANGQPTLLASVNNNTYEFSDTDVRKGERYFYYITSAGSSNRESKMSNPVIISY